MGGGIIKGFPFGLINDTLKVDLGMRAEINNGSQHTGYTLLKCRHFIVHLLGLSPHHRNLAAAGGAVHRSFC